MSKTDKTFIYDKENFLSSFIEVSKKSGLINCYFLKDRHFVKINRFKDKKGWHTRKAVLVFEEPIRLTYFDIEGYGLRFSASRRYSDRIEFPKIHSRIESVDGDTFTNFTIKSDFIDSWVNKL